MKRSIGAAALVLTFAVGDVLAAKNQGFYVEGQFAPRTDYKFDANAIAIPFGGTITVDDDTTDSGFLFGAGYGFNEYFSIGASWVDLGEATATYTETGTNNTVSTALETDGFTIHGQGYIPVGESFYIMGKLGYINGDVAVSAVASDGSSVGTAVLTDDDSGALFGVGGGYYFTDNFAVTFEWSRYQIAEDIDYFGVGAKFSFD